MGRALETTLAVLNGLVGDHLSRTKNGLETPMAFMRANAPLSLDRASLASMAPPLTGRVLVLVHGLMNNETCWELAGGGDYGSYLARDAGFSPFYVRYNTGLPIADNGVALAGLLDRLVERYPVPIEQILLVGYSMGGLVVRSACHEGALRTAPFVPHVKRAIYVGTPHLGAPYERAGRLVSAVLHAIHDPYTRLIGDIADLRSAGLQDLGDADLRHEDRARRGIGVHLKDWRHPVPLLPSIQHHLIAGSLSEAPWVHELFGDALVPLGSALARDPDSALTTPARVLQGRNHIALAHDLEVYEQIRLWAGAA